MSWIGRLTGRAPRDTPAAAPVDAAGTGAILAELRADLAERSNGALASASIDPGAPLLQYGYLDSLSAVSFVEHVRVRYGVHISEDDLVGRLSTLDAVARFVATNRGRSR